MPPLLGCIADDYTGATDVASALRRSGLSVALYFGVPGPEARAPEGDAVVIALKSRTIPVSDAVGQSLGAHAWLRAAGVGRIYLKYCSTFDSTPRGNIGPVADALLEATGAPVTVVCPASPANGRTVYRGRLFVGDLPLDESPMRDHPLTPMRDSDLTRLLRPQTRHEVGRVDHATVRRGARAVREALDGLAEAGVRHAVVDAVDETDLEVIARGGAHLPLLTGAAGLTGGLGGLLAEEAGRHSAPAPSRPSGPAAVLAGSCSAMTLRQIEHARTRMPAHRLDPRGLARGGAVEEALDWVDAHLDSGPVLVYSSAPPEELRAVQDELGVREGASLVEDAMGRLARHLVGRGVRRLVVAGGETSGAAVGALSVRGVEVGDEVAPGVCWVFPHEHPGLALLLKSGNFGDPELFTRSLEEA
ncbi:MULTISPECIES: 3-oxo-tetronate kinase [unclassified Nocardiopsis]|uniref:3-oxo-tetronate kinase n=1 Tax=unclassified Nocardiopsis TaxID=2649073 RepID=UPI00135C57CF|nr:MULTISPECIES: 3-oxo-tetronate kinase [unclassified Nocardiopsis]